MTQPSLGRCTPTREGSTHARHQVPGRRRSGRHQHRRRRRPRHTRLGGPRTDPRRHAGRDRLQLRRPAGLHRRRQRLVLPAAGREEPDHPAPRHLRQRRRQLHQGSARGSRTPASAPSPSTSARPPRPSAGSAASRPPRTPPARLAAFVDRVLAATGATKVNVVGHSQGGLIPTYFIKRLGGASKIDKYVGLAPSNHGTESVRHRRAGPRARPARDRGGLRLLRPVPGGDLAGGRQPGAADAVGRR
ncbi:alpha/beta fold hydrolase [Nocardioides sp. W3-2-3]|uniref:esterase/lipase family protein n=1 Tax=Nocardioides convexus TaxID=2712224 RepID=UPI002418191A|nr:alpha/beta fold hydrolase [Nocardioides convexus]NHA01134.1 alpha/beta fold hydrolase [Nocardioides convexus]